MKALALIFILAVSAVCAVGQLNESAEKTIIVMPAARGLVSQDSVTVLSSHDAIQGYLRGRFRSDAAAVPTSLERTAVADMLNIVSVDQEFSGLLAAYDAAVSQHRGERGRLVREANAGRLATILSELSLHDVQIEAYDLIAGMIFLDGARYDVRTIQSFVPDAVVEEYAGLEYFDSLSNAATRVSWLHDSGNIGGGGETDSSGFDYLLVDTGLDTMFTDIVSGHRIFANPDTTLANPFPHNVPGEFHGTLTCGIVTSINPVAKGVAFGLDAIFVSNYDSFPTNYPVPDIARGVRGFSWGVTATDSLFNDSPEAMHCALGNPHIQEYNGFAKFLDALVDEFDIFLANAAGNQSEIGRNTVADLGHAYNPMVVGSLDMHADSLRTNETRLYDVNGVSWGPTADGRKKPDIFVPVKGMYLHSPNGTVSQTASIYGQTSFAAPQVSAASILLMNCGATNQRTIKALMLNTTFRPDSLSATTWAPGWGWGMLDANHAAYHSMNGDYFENTVRASGLGGDRIYYSGSFAPYDGVNRSYDRSTVVWEKHNSWAYGDTNITGASLTNLDLYLYNGETTELVASSTSLIDNVEQVFWDSLTDTLKLGVLVVQCNSALPAGYDYEPFSIATEEGFTHYTAAKSLVGLHTDFDSMDLPVESGEYSMTFNVWLDGAAECDTIWPDIVDLDANTVVVAGPSPGCLVLAQGDTASVEYTLVSATPGKRSLRFVALAHCYQTYWSDSVVKNFSVLNEDVESTSRPDQEDDPDAVIQFGITSVAVEVNQVVIGYEGAGGGDVALEIFDIRGRRVYSGSAESSGVVAGSMEWRYRDGQGARVASGVYFARLSSTRGAVTRKIVVVR